MQGTLLSCFGNVCMLPSIFLVMLCQPQFEDSIKLVTKLDFIKSCCFLGAPSFLIPRDHQDLALFTTRKLLFLFFAT